MTITVGKPVRVPVNGLELNTRVDGKEGAPWMVFSNSLASSIAMWDEQVAAFGSRFRILRYDQRGHGDSAVPPNHKTDFEELSADLMALLDHYAIEKAVVAGASMGATTILRFAARFPLRCLAAIACDGQWRAPAGSEATWKDRLAVATDQGMQALAAPTAARWFQPEFIANNPDVIKRVEAMVTATPVGGYLACAAALQDYDYRRDYPAIAVPVLYLVGAQDGEMPAVMREMAEATPNSRYQVIDKCGHLPNIEQPEQFYQVVNAFVREYKIA